jgi:hypothetical protein
MVDWAEFSADAPEFAAAVRARFDAGVHKTLATLRRDGSPRISGQEIMFEDASITLGMMAGSLKLADLRRDPRFALHSPTLDETSPTTWAGDAKLAGRAREITPPSDNPVADAAYFALDLDEVVLVRLDDPPERLIIESWHAGRGYRRVARD